MVEYEEVVMAVVTTEAEVPEPKAIVSVKTFVTTVTETAVVVVLWAATEPVEVGWAMTLDKVVLFIADVFATETTEDEIEAAAVTGQNVVVRAMTSVTTMVLRASGGRDDRADASAGHCVTVAAQLVIVRMEVVRTVRVVKRA